MQVSKPASEASTHSYQNKITSSHSHHHVKSVKSQICTLFENLHENPRTCRKLHVDVNVDLKTKHFSSL